MNKPIVINYEKAWTWLRAQGVAIVVLTAFNFLGYQKVNNLENDVKILNQKLIDCEKSKVDYLRLKLSNN